MDVDTGTEISIKPLPIRKLAPRASTRQPSTLEVTLQLVKFGKALGLSAKDIATEANLRPDYVEYLSRGR